MPPQQELGSQGQKRKQASEAVAAVEPELPPPQPPAKRARSKTPPEFWDNLSRLRLCRRALREFDRRTIRPIARRKQCAKRDIEDNQVKLLQRFARRGGPDLHSIRGFAEQGTQPTMASKRGRSNRSSALSSKMKIFSKDIAFEQALIDNDIHPPGYDDVEPDNVEEIEEKLGQRRASLSPLQFSRDDFLHFKRQNNEAESEAAVVSQVIPVIIGKTNIPSGYSGLFNNLEPLFDYVPKPKPDYFNGSRPAEIRSKVRADLKHYIIPSSHAYRAALPNMFMEVKGPAGNGVEAKRQITYDLAAGARGMLKMQSYGLDKPVFDNKAYTFAASYRSEPGLLNLYAMYPTKPRNADGKPGYRTVDIGAFILTSNLNSYCQGVGAFRNMRDLAKEKRDEFIASANVMADKQSTQSELVSADEQPATRD